MTSIETLCARHFDEAMTFLARAFLEHGVADFATLLPALYQRTDEHLNHNIAIRDNGRLVALLGIFPIEWRLGEHRLEVAGIGGVSVDPDFRGRGLMGELLTHACARIAARGYPLSFLGGQRQRYRRYGWEVAGCRVRLELNPRNVAGCTSRTPRLGLSPLADHDRAVTEELEHLHRSQLVHCARPTADFVGHLRAWRHEPLIARTGQGRVAGYLVASPKTRTVFEIAGRSIDDELGLLRALLDDQQRGCAVVLPAVPSPLLARLAAEAESMVIEPSGNYWVRDWVRVAGTLIAFRHAISPLPPGEVVLCADGEVFRLFVSESGAGAEACSATPALRLASSALTRLLFGPLPPASVIELPSAAGPLQAWCPLPLALPVQDHV